MKKYNIIAVFDNKSELILMCKRRKNPYKGLLNFVGGKIKEGEDGFSAAYRELFEETGITENDIELSHLMDFTYYYDNCCLETYVGRLNKEVEVFGSENELVWITPDKDFFDCTKFAGEGNIGHIMLHINMHREELLKI